MIPSTLVSTDRVTQHSYSINSNSTIVQTPCTDDTGLINDITFNFSLINTANLIITHFVNKYLNVFKTE